MPRLEPAEDFDTGARPFSVGTIIGFGFVGGIFGTFAGWCIGLLSHVTGPNLLVYMALGVLIGVVTGVIAGIVITSTTAKAKAS